MARPKSPLTSDDNATNISTRITKELRVALERIAKRNERTLSQEIRFALSSYAAECGEKI